MDHIHELKLKRADLQFQLGFALRDIGAAYVADPVKFCLGDSRLRLACRHYAEIEREIAEVQAEIDANVKTVRA